MAATTTRVQVPCPVCGSPFAWPPTDRCTACHADLPGPVAAAFWQLAREEAELQARQVDLRRQLAATATPAGTMAPHPVGPPAPPRRRLTDLGAQTVLGLAGAALLAVAAVVFAAVTWQDLPTTARAAILVGAAGSAVSLAVWLEGRALHVTAGAVALLADALTATVVWAVHSYGATGDLVDTGGGALAALGAVLVALGLGHRRIRWQPVAAAAAWVAAAGLAATAVVDVAPTAALPLVAFAATLVAALPAIRLSDGSTPRAILLSAGVLGLAATSIAAAIVLGTTDGPAVTAPIVAGLGAAAVWVRLGGRTVGTGAAVAGLTGLAIGALITIDLEGVTVMAGIAGIALVVSVAALFAGTRGLPMLVGSAPATIPAVVWTAITVGTAVGGWAQQVGSPWQEPPPATSTSEPWLAVMALLTASALLVDVAARWRDRWRSTAALALPVAATAALWQLGADVWLLVGVAALGAVAGFARLDGTTGRVGLLAWTLVAVGWSLPSPMLSTITAGTAAALGLAARVAPVGRHVEQSPLVVAMTATAATGSVVWLLGAPDAAAVAGPVAVGLAVVVAGAGRWLDLHGWVTATTIAATGVVAVIVTATVEDLVAAALTSAILGAGAVGLALVWRHDLVAARIHAGTAMAAATATSAMLLRNADVTTPEAYTAVPAALALGAGVAWMVHDPTVRSRRALHPGLALAIAPTLGLLVMDPQDVTRALAAAVIAAVALLVGVGRRIEAPVWYGAAAALSVSITQLVVVAGHVPRWVVFATLGALLVTASATFERQRLRARALRERLGHVASTYR